MTYKDCLNIIGINFFNCIFIKLKCRSLIYNTLYVSTILEIDIFNRDFRYSEIYTIFFILFEKIQMTRMPQKLMLCNLFPF